MLLVTAVAIIAMEWAGRKGSLLLIYYAFGRKAAINYDTRWTAVGVIFMSCHIFCLHFLRELKSKVSGSTDSNGQRMTTFSAM